MKTILLYVEDTSDMETRFQAALSLARQQSAHLACLQLLSDPYLPIETAYLGASGDPILQKSEGLARAQRATIEERLGLEMISWDWQVRMGPPAIEILSSAHLTDVIVVGRGDSVLGSSVVGSLVVHGHMPILVVPGDATNYDPSGPAIIAWNGSSEAANAIRCGLPLLQAASDVHIVAIGEDSQGFPAADVVTYLSRHGIHAEVQEREAERSVEEALMDAARELGASTIIMGGYGHSRMQELVFGGVTRAMLQGCPIPLLLSH